MMYKAFQSTPVMNTHDTHDMQSVLQPQLTPSAPSFYHSLPWLTSLLTILLFLKKHANFVPDLGCFLLSFHFPTFPHITHSLP